MKKINKMSALVATAMGVALLSLSLSFFAPKIVKATRLGFVTYTSVTTDALVVNDGIGTLAIADGAITTGKLGDGSVTTSKMHSEALDGFSGIIGIGAAATTHKIHVENGRINISGGSSSELAVDRAVGGIASAVVLSNSLAHDAGTDETVDIRYNLGPTTGVGVLRFGKENDFQAGADRDSFFAIHTMDSASLGEKLRVEAGGNVGIGITAPLGKLHVEATDSGATPPTNADDIVLDGSMSIMVPDNTSALLNFGTPADTSGGKVLYNQNINQMQVGSTKASIDLVLMSGNGNESIYVESGGNVGIGVTNPVTLLHIEDAAATTSKMQLGAADTAACIMLGDTDEAGCTEVSALNGVLTATTDADCVCDGS